MNELKKKTFENNKLRIEIENMSQTDLANSLETDTYSDISEDARSKDGTTSSTTTRFQQIEENSFDENSENPFKDLTSVLNNPQTVEYFREFLVEHFNQENLLLYIEIEKFKKLSENSDKVDEFAKNIYEKFIKQDSIFEIEMNPKKRNEISDLISTQKIPLTIFNELQENIYNILEQNFWSAFINSNIYKLLRIRYQKKTLENIPQIKKIDITKGLRESKALNSQFEYKYVSRHPCVVAEELCEKIIDICSANYSISTETITLDSVSHSVSFRRFALATLELQNVELNELSSEELIPFFINIYNVLSIHGIILKGTTGEKKAQNKFMNETKYQIGKYFFSLNDIKNGILRQNQGKGIKSKHFKTNDERSNYSIKKLDPRIHFGIVNFWMGSPVRVYYNQNYEEELETTTKTFIEKNVIISTKSKKILLPKLFRKYSKDFGNGINEVLKWILGYFKKVEYEEILNKLNEYEVKFSSNINIPMLIFDSEYSSFK
ncbi:electron carrier/ protein disulfide oxidoreductase [Anaeramoeba ignava]|uniref:Electron carrier/ protein disulfide oxidoreductase n=1 Tax=Anaeramoeba ignava TaxID=1746090 RepID=A0A9Q0LV85_ANAIG|nr:electron carrier/ protein disulfide oxidoreductase [Anaeramoeba ignava]